MDYRPNELRAVLPSRTAYPVDAAAYPRIVSGQGPFVISEAGESYFDASGGSGSLIFGHGDREMVTVLKQQAETLTIFPSRILGVEIVEHYLTELLAFAGSAFERGLTFTSGSDAVEAALKLALHHQMASGRPGRTKIIGRRGSYHGNTLSGLGAAGFVSRRKPYEAVLPHVRKASSAHCRACEFGLTPAECQLECASSVEEAIVAEGPDTVAAFILEPIVGAALSAAVPDGRYLQMVRTICDRHDILLIFDEVMTGFGRTGQPFAWQLSGVVPDILVCGKGMSAGYYPLSGVLATSRITSVFGGESGPFQNGHTHACSPTGAAVGLAVVERLREQALLANVRRRGADLRERLRDSRLGAAISNVRGEGLMIGFDIASDSPGARPGAAADRFQRAALRHGLIIYGSSGGSGTEWGDHAMLLPPLTITEQDVDFIANALVAAAQDPLFAEAS